MGTFLPDSASAIAMGQDRALWGSDPAAPSVWWCPWTALWLYHLFLVVRCLQIFPGVVRQWLQHLPAEVVVGGWLRHREPCRRNRLCSSCLPWERRPTPPQAWMRCCQQLPSARLSTSFCGFSQELPG